MQFAFCVMMNKLIFAGKRILRPYLDELKRNSSDAELKRLARLEKELEKNTEKTYSVRRLMAGNFMTPAISNQENVAENLYDARSRIRDADYAEETAEMTRQSILQQVSTSILVNANQKNDIVLSLLQK